MAEVAQERATLIALLAERGVHSAEDLIAGLEDSELAGAFGAIAMYDDMPMVGGRHPTGPGLLVKRIREGGLPAYKPAHERASVDGTGPPVGMLKSIRGVLSSPDGFSRAEAYDFYRGLAKQLNTTPQALVTSAMGAMWPGTPPHPARDTADPIAACVRYEAWLTGHCANTADLTCLPDPYKGEHEWACRFWGWTDPLNYQELLRLETERRTAVGQRTLPPDQQQQLPVEEVQPPDPEELVTIDLGAEF